SYAKGKLTQVTDPSGGTAWTYNSQGRVASKTQTIGAAGLNVVYTYNLAGQLTGMTLPSGQQVNFGYINNRVASIALANGPTILNGANTQPFGPQAGWAWGNGLYTFRSFDLDGRMYSSEFRNGVSYWRQDLAYDAASRVTGLTRPGQPTLNQGYQ